MITSKAYSRSPLKRPSLRTHVEIKPTTLLEKVGLPGFTIVGLTDRAIQEARERVKPAIRNAGFTFPQRRVAVNVAPAELPKEGTGFDLAKCTEFHPSLSISRPERRTRQQERSEATSSKRAQAAGRLARSIAGLALSPAASRLGRTRQRGLFTKSSMFFSIAALRSLYQLASPMPPRCSIVEIARAARAIASRRG